MYTSLILLSDIWNLLIDKHQDCFDEGLVYKKSRITFILFYGNLI